jgi:hypothetical protein
MIAVRVMQVPIHQIIHVIAMRNLRMAAVWTVNVVFFVPAAIMFRSATVGVRSCHFQHAFVDVIAVYVMQVAVVQIIDVTIMRNGKVAAAWAMLMLVRFHFVTGAHVDFSLFCPIAMLRFQIRMNSPAPMGPVKFYQRMLW